MVARTVIFVTFELEDGIGNHDEIIEDHLKKILQKRWNKVIVKGSFRKHRLNPFDNDFHHKAEKLGLNKGLLKEAKNKGACIYVGECSFQGEVKFIDLGIKTQ